MCLNNASLLYVDRVNTWSMLFHSSIEIKPSWLASNSLNKLWKLILFLYVCSFMSWISLSSCYFEMLPTLSCFWESRCLKNVSMSFLDISPLWSTSSLSMCFLIVCYASSGKYLAWSSLVSMAMWTGRFRPVFFLRTGYSIFLRKSSKDISVCVALISIFLSFFRMSSYFI